jgi:tape measure domain-containing protein
MAGKIPAGEFNTRFTVDGSQPVETLKQIKSEVSSLTAGWKAQEAQLNSAGDAVGAAQAKYDGLSNAVSKQKDYISQLTSQQKQLDTSTNEGAESYAKLERQIATATTRINSMTAQQDRAKQSLSYQKSGLAELQSQYRQMTQTSASYVARLEAEGKVQEANTAKMGGYRKAISSLNSQLKAQESELNRIASESGKTSDAYQKQEVRVNETATALAKTKTGMNDYAESMRKANPSVFDKIREHVTATNKETEKGGGLLKKFVAGGVISNAISNGWSTFTSQIKSTVTEGTALAEAGEQAERVWNELGVSNKGADALVAQMRNLKSETNLSADQVSTLQKRFYGMTGSVKQTEALTTGVATLADKLRLNGDAASSMAKSLQRAFNNGTLTTGVLTRMENTAPGLGSALAKASGLSEQAFNKMVASGQMSSAKLQGLITKIGSSSKQTFADFGKTSEGATQELKGAWQSAEATLAKPLVSVQSTGISSIVNVLKSSAVTALFTSLGKAMANVAKEASNLLNYVAAHQKDIGGIVTSLSSIIKVFANQIWKTISGIVSSIAQSFDLMGSGASKAADPLKNANTALANVAKNKSGIQTTAKVMLGLWAAVKGGEIAAKVAKGAIMAVGTAMDLFAKRAQIMAAAQKVLNVVAEANPWVKLAMVILAVGTALVELYKHNAKFKAFVDGMVKGVQQLWQGMTKWIGSLVKSWDGAWKSISKGWSGFLKTMGNWGKSLSSAWSKIWNPISKGMSAIWNGIVKVAKAGLNVLKTAIILPVALVVGLFIKAWQKLEGPFKAVWNALVKFVKPPLDNVAKTVTGAAKSITNAWDKAWSGILKFFSTIWNGLVKVTGQATNWITKNVSAFLQTVGKVWNSTWKAISSFFSAIWNGMVKFLTPIINGMGQAISNVINGIKKTWNTVWGAISSFFSTIWNDMVKFYSPIIHGISSTIGSVIKGIQTVWKDVWGSIGKFFGGIWDGIKKAAQDGINFVINVIRTGLNAVNGVLGFFGVKKVSLPHYVKFAQGGEVGSNGARLAMVNDDGTDNYKELIHKKRTGEWLYSDKRNTVLPLETGDRVYNAKQSKAIAKAYGIPNFASGGIMGSIWDGVKDATSFVADKAEDVGKWIGDKATAITDWIAHPIKHVTELIKKSISGLVDSAPVKAFGDLGAGIFNHAYNGIASWVKKHLETVKKSMESSSVAGQPKEAQAWLPIIKKIMKEMGANPPNGIDSEAAAFVREIARESGGNPTIRQTVWDKNMANGDPAMGLLQFIPSTFMTFAVPGHTNILNGEDQIMATINAYMHSGAWGNIGTGRQINFLANGGIATIPSIVGEAGAESVIPLSAIKSSRSYEMLGQTAAILAARDNVQQQSTDAPASNAQMLKLMQQNNDLVQMIITLITPKMTSDDNQKDVPLNQALQVLVNKISQIQHNTAYQTRRTGGARS